MSTVTSGSTLCNNSDASNYSSGTQPSTSQSPNVNSLASESVSNLWNNSATALPAAANIWTYTAQDSNSLINTDAARQRQIRAQLKLKEARRRHVAMMATERRRLSQHRACLEARIVQECRRLSRDRAEVERWLAVQRVHIHQHHEHLVQYHRDLILEDGRRQQAWSAAQAQLHSQEDSLTEQAMLLDMFRERDMQQKARLVLQGEKIQAEKERVEYQRHRLEHERRQLRRDRRQLEQQKEQAEQAQAELDYLRATGRADQGPIAPAAASPVPEWLTDPVDPPMRRSDSPASPDAATATAIPSSTAATTGSSVFSFDAPATSSARICAPVGTIA